MTNASFPGLLLPALSLWRREVVRFLRQRERISATLVTPLAFWILIGAGVGTSFRPEGAGNGGYLAYFFPGALMLMVLFTAITSTISVIEDRREGFLQGVLVSPAPRAAVALGKLLGCTTLGVLQGAALLALAPLAGGAFSWKGSLAALGVLALAAFALSGLGFVLIWHLETVQGFHAFMNLLLLPMWLLSGAAFPAEGAAPWMRAAMAWNPLTYPMAALRRALHPGLEGGAAPAAGEALLVTGLFAAAAFAAAAYTATRRDAKSGA
jgi:ABC-2 type transport system permease protein